MAFENLEQKYWNNVDTLNSRGSFFVSDYMTKEMEGESKDLGAVLSIVSLIAQRSTDKDVLWCAKRLSEISLELINNIAFPNMIGRYCELLDQAETQIEDLEDLGEKTLAKYASDELLIAKELYSDWRIQHRL